MASGTAKKKEEAKLKKKVKISLDLVSVSKLHLHFLQTVDQHPNLYEGPVVKNAIRR